MIYNNDIYQRLSKVCHGIKFQNKFEYKIRPKDIMVSLTLYFAMSQNGQTYFKNLAANAARFLKCV